MQGRIDGMSKGIAPVITAPRALNVTLDGVADTSVEEVPMDDDYLVLKDVLVGSGEAPRLAVRPIRGRVRTYGVERVVNRVISIKGMPPNREGSGSLS